MTYGRRFVAALVVAVAALAWDRPADAQVFLASKPHPEFSVGPVFVIANVKPDLSVSVNLSFSLTPRPAARPDALEQDVYLLWPAEVVEPTAPGAVDPSLAAETFWGRRHILTIGFGDLGSPAMPLYPLYFEHRDRAIRLAREYSVVTASFADSDHLLIDSVEPPAATRRPSRVRAGSEVVTLPLSPTETLTPQGIKVQFSYFAGRIAWRPIVVSIVLLLLGNIAGAIMFGREAVQMVRARRRKRVAMALHRGPWLSPDGLRSLRPGVATYDDVIARWGPPDEERERIAPPGRLTVFYRATRDGRMDEIAIELEDGRVAEVLRTTRRVDH
jgi:hypothetical protein